MPSLKTRIAYQGIVLETAQASLSDAASSVAAATETLTDIQSGNLDLAAVRIGGQRFINNGGNLEVEP
jgi:hypothetical protein